MTPLKYMSYVIILGSVTVKNIQTNIISYETYILFVL